jgi:hypothetical protein
MAGAGNRRHDLPHQFRLIANPSMITFLPLE